MSECAFGAERNSNVAPANLRESIRGAQLKALANAAQQADVRPSTSALTAVTTSFH